VDHIFEIVAEIAAVVVAEVVAAAVGRLLHSFAEVVGVENFVKGFELEFHNFVGLGELDYIVVVVAVVDWLEVVVDLKMWKKKFQGYEQGPHNFAEERERNFGVVESFVQKIAVEGQHKIADVVAVTAVVDLNYYFVVVGVGHSSLVGLNLPLPQNSLAVVAVEVVRIAVAAVDIEKEVLLFH
jgi:hypothetical protein